MPVSKSNLAMFLARRKGQRIQPVGKNQKKNHKETSGASKRSFFFETHRCEKSKGPNATECTACPAAQFFLLVLYCCNGKRLTSMSLPQKLLATLRTFTSFQTENMTEMRTTSSTTPTSLDVMKNSSVRARPLHGLCCSAGGTLLPKIRRGGPKQRASKNG